MELMQSEGWELVTPLYREGVWHYPMKDKEEEMFSTYNQTVDEIANTIYSLRTHKSVEDGFPEAFPFLPDRIGSTEMVIQLQPTRDKVTTLLGLKSATHE